MKNTNIQWCHSTINPVMGCTGCELWPHSHQLITNLVQFISAGTPTACSTPRLPTIQKTVAAVVGDRVTSAIYADHVKIAADLAKQLHLTSPVRDGLVDVVRRSCKCYAGLQETMRAGQPGHAGQFEQPKLFPGRMAEAAHWGPPTLQERAAKPWLLNAPRMIFISDMGDALSRDVSFQYLKMEIIDAVVSEPGWRHLWLWLSKRPSRMAEFGRWLNSQGIAWPDNLVAMTTVTSPATAGRIAELRKVPSRFKGLSCEPVFAPLTQDLSGIDWLIMGGGSDVLAEPFQVEWALSLRQQCREANTAFFLKQLGRHPMFQGAPLNLEDSHGGDWTQWAASWQTREIPKRFLLII
jgi:protein gp37